VLVAVLERGPFTACGIGSIALVIAHGWIAMRRIRSEDAGLEALKTLVASADE
jgi:hypothetical protein